MLRRMPLHKIRLRPVVASDETFLRTLYANVRWPELELTGWPDEQKWQFCNMQFDAQDRHYRAQYPDGEFQIVEQMATGNEAAATPIGRVYWARVVAEREDALMEMSLIPTVRGCGIGGALIESILDRAERSSHSVSLHVEPTNPARRLYERFGFVTVASSGVYDEMLWQPPVPTIDSPG